MLKLTTGGDLARENGAFTTYDESTNTSECIGQRIVVRLRRWLGEWSFDTRLGVDWESLLQKSTTSGQLRAAITREITRVPGIRAVSSMEIIFGDNREVIITGNVLRVGTDIPVEFSANVEI